MMMIFICWFQMYFHDIVLWHAICAAGGSLPKQVYTWKACWMIWKLKCRYNIWILHLSWFDTVDCKQDPNPYKKKRMCLWHTNVGGNNVG